MLIGSVAREGECGMCAVRQVTFILLAVAFYYGTYIANHAD